MSGGRYALVVANGQYDDPKLKQLRAPAADAEALARVLGDPEIGRFDVELVMDEPDHVLRRKVSRFLANRKRDDTLLLHFSCHGMKDDSGHLFFAARDTDGEDLHASAMAFDWLNERIEDSRSTKIVVLLDCCYSGAISRGRTHRAGAAVHATEQLEGNGRVILTASSAFEYAWEGDALSGEPEPSVFTKALVQGLETGEADRDQDQWIGINELYEYICDRIKQEGAPQKPQMDCKVQGELRIARNPHVRPAPLDAHVTRLLDSEVADGRLAAVALLAKNLERDDGKALSARQTLVGLAADDDSFRVREAARLALANAPLEADPVPEPDPAPEPEPEPEPEPPAPPPTWGSGAPRELACLTHDDAVMDVVLGSDGLVATASRDHTARLWEAASGRERARFAHDDWVIAVASSTDWRLLATACRDRSVGVWDLDTGSGQARLPHDSMPWSIELSADGGLLAVGCADGIARVWDVAAERERVRVQHDAGVVSVALDPDGAMLATASRDTARAWDLTGRELARVVADGVVLSAGFGEDRRLLTASAGPDACTVTDGRDPLRLEHAGVRAVAFDASGRLVATAGDDRTARVWELESGRELARLEHPDPVRAVSFAADGLVLATAGRCATARVWSAEPPR